jgi:hypothetical protein
MLIFQYNPDDPRNVRLLDHEIANYLTNVIHSYILGKESLIEIIKVEYIAQELIIMHLRRAIKQGYIKYNDVMIKGQVNHNSISIKFDINAKLIGVVPNELQNWTNIAMDIM